MKPFALLIALGVLAGCGHPVRHYRPTVETVVPKPPTVTLPGPDEIAVERPAEVIVDSRPVPPPLSCCLPRPANPPLTDAYFPYDRSEPLPESVAALEEDARLLRTLLRDFPGTVIIVEGHCDDRGSAEYNVGLGDRRARTAARILGENGVPVASLEIVSFGREMPQCTEFTEACRQRNRRAHLTVRPVPSPETVEVPAGGTPPPDRHPR